MFEKRKPNCETLHVLSFVDWWAKSNERVDGQVEKGLNSIIILGAWAIWNLRNRCVFDGISPSLEF